MKGETAEVGKMPEFCLLGRQRTSAGLSQSFVKRYRCSAAMPLFCVVPTVESLDEAIRFFIYYRKEETKMKKLIAIVLSALMMLSLVACGNGPASTDISGAKSIADLKGAKIAAQIFLQKDRSLYQFYSLVHKQALPYGEF